MPNPTPVSVSYGSQTNGIGQRSSYHLNLTRSLADVGIITPVKRPAQRKPKPVDEAAKMGRPPTMPKSDLRYFLRNGKYYVHESTAGATLDRTHAWRGTPEQMTRLREQRPILNNWKAEIVL